MLTPDTNTSSFTVPLSNSYTTVVESTSWVAVQALADKYQIPLRPLDDVIEDVREAYKNYATQTPEQTPAVPVTENCLQSSIVITARPLSQGRTVYRFVQAHNNGNRRSYDSPSKGGIERLAAHTLTTIRAKASNSLLSTKAAPFNAKGSSFPPTHKAPISPQASQRDELHQKQFAADTHSPESSCQLAPGLPRIYSTSPTGDFQADDVLEAIIRPCSDSLQYSPLLDLPTGKGPPLLRDPLDTCSDPPPSMPQRADRISLDLSQCDALRPLSEGVMRRDKALCTETTDEVCTPTELLAPLTSADESTEHLKAPRSLETLIAERRISSRQSSRSSIDMLRTPTFFDYSSTPSQTRTCILAISKVIDVLTSVIDARFLTDFFLTFRVFISPPQLLTLLIERFSWAHSTMSQVDGALRRVVLVRTYVTFKYWLQHFFEIDFLPSRSLRHRLTTWLNNAISESESPLIVVHIVKSLKIVVRDLKQIFECTGISALLTRENGRLAPAEPLPEDVHQDDDEFDICPGGGPGAALKFDGTKSGADPDQPARRRSVISPRHLDSTAVDPLDLTLQLPSRRYTLAATHTTNQIQPDFLSRAFSNTMERLSRMKRSIGGGSGKGDGVSLEVFAQASDLLLTRGGAEQLLSSIQHQNTKAVPKENTRKSASERDRDRTPSLGACSAISTSTPVSPLDISETAAAGRWPGYQAQDKPCSHHLSTTAEHSNGADDCSSGFDGVNDKYYDAESGTFEPYLSGCGVNIRTAAFLQEDQTRQPLKLAHEASEVEKLLSCSNGHRMLTLVSSSRSFASLRVVHTAGSSRTPRFGPTDKSDHELSERIHLHRSPLQLGKVGERCDLDSESLFRSSNRESMQADCIGADGQVSIIQIDDVDWSSDEDEGASRHVMRSLPGAKYLRMANAMVPGYTDVRIPRSTSLVQHAPCEICTTSQEPVRSSSSPLAASISQDSAALSKEIDFLDPDDALAGLELVKGFRADDFASDDGDELGGVEEALRRLEGLVDEGKRLERAQRVEVLWAKSQLRQSAAAELTPPPCCKSLQCKEEGQRSNQIGFVSPLTPSPQNRGAADNMSGADAEEDEHLSETRQHKSATGLVDFDVSGPLLLAHSILKQSTKAKEAFAMNSISSQRSRTACEQSVPASSPPSFNPSQIFSLEFGRELPLHRCFLLEYRSGTIARQFTLIERELFSAIDWTDLAMHRWQAEEPGHTILDWEAFYKARCQARHSARAAGKLCATSAIEAVVARINLTCNWVASQVVLTRHIDERVLTIAKLIRVAFKCYQQSNYATLVAICLGLQSPWVERLKKTWSKVGSWEMRVLQDLKTLASPQGDFASLRAAMRDLHGDLEELVLGPLHAVRSGHRQSSIGKRSRMSNKCIPFFGIFVSDLAKWHRLPSGDDTASVTKGAGVPCPTDRNGVEESASSIDAPKELLVNLVKMRRLGSTLRAFIALQQIASNYDYKADGPLYNKCLRLRCLDGEQMAQLSQWVE